RDGFRAGVLHTNAVPIPTPRMWWPYYGTTPLPVWFHFRSCRASNRQDMFNASRHTRKRKLTGNLYTSRAKCRPETGIAKQSTQGGLHSLDVSLREKHRPICAVGKRPKRWNITQDGRHPARQGLDRGEPKSF